MEIPRMECSALILIFATLVTTHEFTKYLSNEELFDYLREVNDNYQNMTHLYSIGTSGMGEELWVLMITLAPHQEIAVPNVKVIGNIHGNEPVGRELIIYFIKMLLEGYADNNEDIIHLLQTTKLHFLPTANPDGFSKAMEGECRLAPGRKNSNNVDLNRDFLPVFSLDDNELFRQRERETTAIVQWMSEFHFVLSVSIHSGSQVVVYPYDESIPGASTNAGGSLTDDNDVFKHLALKYASSTKGAIYDPCPDNGHRFEHGISNGALWYSARGTMGDYNYHYHGCMELTVEVSCCKYPHPSKLGDIIDNHSGALLTVIKEVHQGVKGVVTCGGYRAVSYIKVLGRNLTIQTNEDGEYWRILLPGRYFLEVESSPCKTQIFPVEIPKRKAGKYPEPVVYHIHLKKDVIPWVNTNDEIDLEQNEAEETLNVTVIQDGLYQIWNTTEDTNINTNSNNGVLVHSLPHMESSISGSTIQSIPFSLIVGSCWILVLIST